MASFIDELVSGYQELRRVLSRELDVHDAADIAQSSFEHALRYGQSRELHSAQGLLFRIASNLQKDRGRRRQRVRWEPLDQKTELNMVSETTPEQSASARQSLDQLCLVIDQLPPRCREAFILHRIHGLSHAQVAEEMKISIGVVEKHLVRAMKACAELMIP